MWLALPLDGLWLPSPAVPHGGLHVPWHDGTHPRLVCWSSHFFRASPEGTGTLPERSFSADWPACPGELSLCPLRSHLRKTGVSCGFKAGVISTSSQTLCVLLTQSLQTAALKTNPVSHLLLPLFCVYFIFSLSQQTRINNLTLW